MTAHAYSEDQLVEQPAIGLFAELGWQTLSADTWTLSTDFASFLAKLTAGTYICCQWQRRVASWQS